MPDLNKYGVPQYDAGQPYHYEYDNLPLKTLARRDEVINDALDIVITTLEGTAANAGTLSNRLNQSLDGNGNLYDYAVDQAMHNIANHTDGSTTVTSEELAAFIDLGFPSLVQEVDFVRMLAAERAKLSQIDENATELFVEVETTNQSVLTFGNEGNPTLALMESDTIEWTYTGPNQIKANVKGSNPHQHFYEQIPITLNYVNFNTTSIPTPFKEGSLRVYINGVRLNSTSQVKVPNHNITAWTLNRFTPVHTNGTFILDTAITASDVITIDFDIELS